MLAKCDHNMMSCRRTEKWCCGDKHLGQDGHQCVKAVLSGKGGMREKGECKAQSQPHTTLCLSSCIYAVSPQASSAVAQAHADGEMNEMERKERVPFTHRIFLFFPSLLSERLFLVIVFLTKPKKCRSKHLLHCLRWHLQHLQQVHVRVR